MTYVDIALRTQISLTEAERRMLAAEAGRTGRSISAQIREAVDRAYGTTSSARDDLASMGQAFGGWKTPG